MPTPPKKGFSRDIQHQASISMEDAQAAAKLSPLTTNDIEKLAVIIKEMRDRFTDCTTPILTAIVKRWAQSIIAVVGLKSTPISLEGISPKWKTGERKLVISMLAAKMQAYIGEGKKVLTRVERMEMSDIPSHLYALTSFSAKALENERRRIKQTLSQGKT